MSIDQLYRATPHRLRVTRSCTDAARELLDSMPADNTLRPVQPSERIFQGKRPTNATVRVALCVASKELGIEIVTVTLNGVLYVARVNQDAAMQSLAEKFRERDATYPGYAPLTLVSTFDEI